MANRILSFRGGKLELYSGNYTNYRAQVTSGRFDERVEGVAKYVVDKKFTDWSTGQRYVPGDIVEISEGEFNNFRWAMESGRLVPLKRDGAIARHKN